jgi:hypothetical protein
LTAGIAILGYLVTSIETNLNVANLTGASSRWSRNDCRGGGNSINAGNHGRNAIDGGRDGDNIGGTAKAIGSGSRSDESVERRNDSCKVSTSLAFVETTKVIDIVKGISRGDDSSGNFGRGTRDSGRESKDVSHRLSGIGSDGEIISEKRAQRVKEGRKLSFIELGNREGGGEEEGEGNDTLHFGECS